MSGQLIEFAAVCERLAATGSKLEKRAMMAEYLRSLELGDQARAALYLAGMPFAPTDNRQLNAGGALLSRVLAGLSKASDQALHAAYLRHGDLGGAAQDLLNDLLNAPPQNSPKNQQQSIVPSLTLEDIDSAFGDIAAAPKPADKERLFSAILSRTTPIEAKYLVKIILGDLRTGVKESLVEEAIAAAYDAEIAEVRRASMLSGSLAEVVALAAGRRLHEARMQLFHPLGFMLASPVATVEEALERFSQELTLETGDPAPAEIGSERSLPQAAQAHPPHAKLPKDQLSQARIEDKYDGIRAQIHCGDPTQPGRVALFSRSRGEITASFPEIVEAFAEFPEPAILDGELLAWHPAGDPAASPAGSPASPGRALPFTALQPRLGRKRFTAQLREAAPVIFMAFDLLYAAGELLLDRSLAERRQTLEKLVARAQPRTTVGMQPASDSAGTSLRGQARLQFGPPEPAQWPIGNGFARLVLAPETELRSVEQLERAYVDARARGNEGVMLKAIRSTYQPGRRGLAWLKLKRELATLDVVVTAAEYGHGKRAGTLSDYTFAVRDGLTLKNIGKAYSGLTDAEIATLTEFFLEHTIEDFGRVRSVEPLIVLEVAFNNIMRSDRHDSGFALRFPRIVRIRYDKPVSEIDTMERVTEIYESQEAAPAVSGVASGNPPGGLDADLL